MYKSKSIHQLMNNYLNNHTLSNAWLVLNYVRKYPTVLSGLNRIELAIYKAIVVNCGKEIK